MVMGTGIRDIRSVMKGFHSNEFFSDRGDANAAKVVKPQSFLGQDHFLNIPFVNPIPNVSPSDSHEDSEIFSDIALSYINQMLMEEDMDEKIDQEYSVIRAAEKPFYDILGKKYPPSPDQPPFDSHHSLDSPDDSSSSPHYGNSSGGGGGSGSSNSSSGLVDGIWPYDFPEYQFPQIYPGPVDYSSQSSFGSTNSAGNFVEGLEDSPLDGGPGLFLENQSAWQFKRGVEEAQKFLPSNAKLVIDLEANGFSWPLKSEGNGLVEVKSEREERESPVYGSKGRKNPHSDDLDLEEGRSIKQSAVFSEEVVRSEMFDLVLLCQGDKCPNAIRDLQEALQIGTNKNSENGQSKGAGGGKGRGKKQSKKEVVDLRTLLIHCAQSVAGDDRRSANELLKQIRQHSSPFGDGSQRLAHCFADGLEARLAGTGSQIYHSLMAKRRTATDILKAYQLYIAACPFKKMSYFFSNQTIMDVSEKAARVHVIDFGIGFGFQWPSLIQRLAARPGGPPKLRITGIDLPQPGFRPSERIEETGRRLADYARSFNVPFEYKSIASKWEAIRNQDLHIEKGEVLIVNCLFPLRLLADETVVVDCPRNIVLNNIRKMNPDVFIHAVINGAFSAPFFVTRFREALYHFSAMFDMLETNVPREDEQRLLIERDIFGREALNVIACEGLEREERPETYKQWQVRTLRAGFRQLPLNPAIVKKATDKVRGCYHKDFIIDEDSRWLLQGWKGRIIYALSTWKPNHVS